MEKRKGNYLFCIAPTPGTETWEKLGMFLNQQSLKKGSYEDGEITVGGRSIRGWMVDYSVITQLVKHIQANPFLKASYFEKKGDGQWRRCNLPGLHRKAAKLKQAAARLEEIKKGETGRETQ